MEFSQSKRAQVQYYEYEPRLIDPYDRNVQVDVAEVAATVIAFIVALAIWLTIMWRLPSKAGYKGISRWVWFVTMGFPVTTAWSLLVFILLPWPIQKELKKHKQGKPLRHVKNDVSDIDAELERLKRGEA